MEAEVYKVEVLHFINPYLIWVEVPDDDGNRFEQVGIFGVLPLEMTMDLTEDTLKTNRSSEWMPAAMVLMKNVLADATEVSFCPVHIDHRSTIFDDNTHKYGEIIIKKKSNGKYRLLSKLLVKSSFAIYDETAFNVELSSGNIKTKLNHSKIKDIIKHLEKKCKAQVAKQTKMFQTAQQIESALTVKNLEAHNRRTKTCPDNFEEVLQRKLEDIQMCKEIDQESVGRASKKKGESSECSSILMKKINLLKGNPSEKPEGIAKYFIKKKIDDLTALSPSTAKNLQTSNMQVQEQFWDENKQSKVIDVTQKQDDRNYVEKDNQNSSKNMQQELKETQCNVEGRILGEDKSKKDNQENKSFGSDNFDERMPVRVRKPKKARSSPNKPPDFDIYKETRIAYGPPGTNLNVLSCKIVQKDSFVETYDPPALREENIPMKKDKEDIFDEEDSDTEKEKPFTRATETKCKLLEPQEFSTDKIVNTPLRVEDTPTDVSSDNVTRKLDPKHQQTSENGTTSSSLLKLKLRYHKENLLKKKISPETSDTSTKDSSISDDVRFSMQKVNDMDNTFKRLDSDDEGISTIIDKLNREYQPFLIPKKYEQVASDQLINQEELKNHVNPFKNLDANVSKFVDKLVTPVLMVHSKKNKRFQPTFQMRDVPFNSHIQLILKNMSIDKPMMLQTLTWRYILRGYSTFMISPKRSGKTMGYLPAVCRLVADKDSGIDDIGPMSIIVCATSNSVSEIEKLSKCFFGRKEKVLAIYSGMNELDIATSLLNGCDMLICTPSILVRLLQGEVEVNLRRLTSFVLDDCERLAEVFGDEIKFFLFKIKEMLKKRIQKEVKVQFIVSSRIWCDFMEPLSKNAPDSVICIGAFQECVLYSKANTTASFVTKENKIKSVLEFLKDIDHSKRTVIACRTDEEVEEVKTALLREKYIVLDCNSEMSVENLHDLRVNWDEYKDPVIGPILLGLDGNLIHLNVTNAHYLIQYSLPSLFSTFCKRFSVLNDNYPSIFKQNNESVKIKILLEDSNVEQLPKILHFIKRCTSEVPPVFDEVCAQILDEKDKAKAKKMVPICDNLLTLGECPDFWNCQERHTVVKEFDEPQEWVPKEGTITFKILHYHTAVLYSARLLSHTAKGETYKYPQKYNMLAMKISMYYSRESNKKLHGVPEVGDVCAVSIKQNFFVRGQVVKILNYYQNGKPNYVLVRLIDEEKLERTRDIYLYYLPEELTTTQTHVVHIRLANLQPKDRDITFSDLAREQLKKITDDEEDLYMRGRISLTIGNCVIIESVEAMRDLSTVKKTVVLNDFKKFLLERHAILNKEHLQKLNKLCIEGGMEVKVPEIPEISEVSQPVKKLPSPQWAHLEKDDLSAVLFASAKNPSTFFVRLVKFEESCNILVKDIQKYAVGVLETVKNVCKGDIVLAKLPDDDMFERARIDEILSEDKVKCFFVDQGDWREVSNQNLIPITEKFITQLPFQAIECRLVGVKSPGDSWTEFATNWFTNCFEDDAGDFKQIYVKYFTKEKSLYTGGYNYGVVLIDTNSDEDIVINELILQVNLAEVEESEINYLNKLDLEKNPASNQKETEEEEDSWEKVSKTSKASSIGDFEQPKLSLNDVFLKKPIRSVPLIGSDQSDTSEDRWQINMAEDFMPIFKPVAEQSPNYSIIPNLPAIENVNSKDSSEVSADVNPCKNHYVQVHASCNSDSDSSIQKLSPTSDIQVVPSMKAKELDSDDYTSSDSSLLATKSIEKPDLLKETATRTIQRNPENILLKTEKGLTEPESLRKPKLLWHQKNENVTIKISLIGADKYDLKVDTAELKFHAVVNDIEYGFELKLYGIIDKNNVTHANKGQYIRINLVKLMVRDWLTLTRGGGIQKWIVYDVEALDVDSSEEEKDDNFTEEYRRGLLCKNVSDSEDEEFIDDVNFGYSR